MNKEQDSTRDEYPVVKEGAVVEIKVKGSRFIARVLPVADRQNAEKRYEEIRKQFYKATHNCMAYRIDQNIFRYSDDGEPSGTAGQPILQAIDGAGVLETLCVVTRYFGGTKLGTGGLIRAYGEAARLALERSVIVKKTRRRQLRIQFKYELETPIRRLIERFHARLDESVYGEEITMDVSVPKSLHERFVAALTETTNSQAKVIFK